MKHWLIGLILLGAFSGAIPLAVEAAAPTRSATWCTSVGLSCPNGLPYAEATLCAGANILACEDFNGGPSFFAYNGSGGGCPLSCPSAWYNPAQTGIGTGLVQTYGTASRQINQASQYIAKPQGSLASNGADYVWAANYDSGLGNSNGNGSSWLYLRDVGVPTYANGTSAVREFHVRFQIYHTDTANGDHASWVPDGFPKSDPYNNSTDTCLGVKIMFHYTPGGRFTPASSSTDGGLGSGCGWFDGFQTAGAGASGARYGNGLQLFTCGGPCNYETSPMCYGCSVGPQHMEYGGYQSANVSTKPNDALLTNRAWRYNIGRWYTFEYHVKWSDLNQANGIGEVWVDGTKIYSMNNLRNCNSSGLANDNCAVDGLGVLYLSAYTNAAQGDKTPFNGQMIIDNIVVAAGDTYIGPPGAGSPADSTPPAAPTGLRVAELLREMLEWIFG